jgi:transcriptional regulator with XRE-family HTH domain
MDEGSRGEEIGKALRAAREQRLFSRAALAEKAGVAEITIALIELGRVARPRRTTIEKLAAVLGVATDSIIDGEKPVPLDEKRRLGDVVSDQRLDYVHTEINRLFEQRRADEINEEDYKVAVADILNYMVAAAERASKDVG